MAQRTCTVAECEGKHLARGFCNRHYKQSQIGFQLQSDLIDGLRRSDWAKIQRVPESGCWLWTGYVNPHTGYGRTSWNRTAHDTHRYVWLRLRGPISEGLELDHLCRVRACVNPDHLEPVTHRENVARGVAPVAEHMRKTHCPRGHEYDRVVHRSSGRAGRACKACDRLAYHRRKRHEQETTCTSDSEPSASSS